MSVHPCEKRGIPGVLSRAYFARPGGEHLLYLLRLTCETGQGAPFPQLVVGSGNVFWRLTVHVSVSGWPLLLQVSRRASLANGCKFRRDFPAGFAVGGHRPEGLAAIW